jgi:hypothetical protein
MNRSIAFVLMAGVVAFSFAACGRVDDGKASGDAGGDVAASPPPPPPPGGDGAVSPSDASLADAPPLIACDGGLCTLPPSQCLDDETMRYFYGASCSDAGTCDYQYTDMHCDPSAVKPDCYQGGCRVVIVR